MAKIGQVGGSALSPDAQKIYDKLVELLKGGKKLDISIEELKKKAGTPNIANSTVSAIIAREKNKGTKFFKNINVTQFAGGLEAGVSKYDFPYNTSKNFRNFYKQNYDTPWEQLGKQGLRDNIKQNSYKRYLRNKGKPTKTGFILSGEQLAKKLGVSFNTLQTYFTPGRVRDVDSTTASFVRDNIQKIRTIKDGKSVTLYKDPSDTVLRNWKTLQESSQISTKLVNNIKEYDNIFRDQIKNTKKLPDISEVIQKTSMKTPATIANTEALYSRLLRGEKFRRDVGIARDVVLGKRIIDELSINSTNNARRSAFYRLALDNVNKMFPNESGNLETFKTNFRNELKAILGLKGKKAQVPFSINEVISVAAGESRGVQPFTAFVDVVETGINKKQLANYQGSFSRRLGKVQELLSGSKPDVVEAKRIAGLLDSDRTTLVDSLTKKGFTKTQIGQLNLPDIKVGTEIDPKIYSPEKLARWKKQTKGALDIEQFVKDKGYYVDIKKAKPFWESRANNTVIAAARNNVGNICNIFKGKIAYSAEGGRIGFQGGCGREMTVAMQTDSKGTLQQITKTEGILPKFKNVAQGFLGALGKFGPTAGKYGAIMAAGAIAQPLVKQFMNDDPSTYLTDPDQQAGMLEALIEGERPKPRSEILDWGTTAGAVGATAAAVPGTGALYKFRRGLSEAKIPKAGPISKEGLTAGDYLSKHAGKGYGKIRAGAGVGMKLLSGMFTPAGLLATEPLRIAQKRREGESWGDIATSPMTWMGPAFAPGMTKIATAGMKKGSLLPRLLRLGISRGALAAMGPVGWAGLAASLGWEGYSQYQDYKKGRGFFASDED